MGRRRRSFDADGGPDERWKKKKGKKKNNTKKIKSRDTQLEPLVAGLGSIRSTSPETLASLRLAASESGKRCRTAAVTGVVCGGCVCVCVCAFLFSMARYVGRLNGIIMSCLFLSRRPLDPDQLDLVTDRFTRPYGRYRIRFSMIQFHVTYVRSGQAPGCSFR